MLTRASNANGVKLPFLSVSRNTENRVVPEPCGPSGYAMAFTSLRDAGSYLQAKNDPCLELELISRPSVARYLDNLEQAGCVGVGFDTKAEGDGAALFSLAELRALLAQ